MRLRQVGLLVAWAVAVACGAQVARAGDLLEGALRGAVVWAGLVLLWMAGVTAWEQVLRGSTEHRAQSAEPKTKT
jgi:hypothetical protein